MTKRRDSAFNMVAVLALVCAGAGLALGVTYQATRGKIKAEQDRAKMAALRIVLPEADEDGFQAVSVPKAAYATDGRYYEAHDAEGKLVGYALEAAGSGYSSTIRVTVGIDPKGESIRGIKVTFQQETPGLGANCEAIEVEGTLWDVLLGERRQAGVTEPWFQAQFRGKRADSFSKIGNKYQNIDGLTGATITTNAVTDGVLEAVRSFRREVLKAEG